jgi:hypothetical protein
MENIEIENITKFEHADVSALETHGVAQAFIDVGLDDRKGEALFGEVPEVYVLSGNVSLEKDTYITGTGGVYIVNGSLSAKGELIFSAADANTVLVITGDLIVSKNFAQTMDCQLIILGDAKIGGILWIDVSDAGFTVFRGAVSASAWAQTNDSVDQSLLFAKPVVGRELEYNWDEGSEYRSLAEKFQL